MQGVFGLDIGDKSIKVIEGKMSGGVFSITAIGEAPVPDGAVRNWEIKDEEALATAIKDLLGATKPRPIRARMAVVCVPEQKVFLHSMKPPQVSEEKMTEVVKWELAANISEDISEMYWDWESAQSPDGQGIVLAAAASREILGKYESMLAKIGIKVVAFDMESKALARAVGGQLSTTGGTLIVDFSAQSTSLSVYQQGLVTFTSGLNVGGDVCTEEISKDQGVDLEKAEQMKRQVDLSKSEDEKGMRPVVCPTVDSIAQEIRRTIDFYNNRKKGQVPIDKVILAGGASLMKGLPEYLQLKLDVKVEMANVLRRLSQKSQKLVTGKSLVYGTVLGLGERAAEDDPVTQELNLISQSLQENFLSRGLRRGMRLLLVTTIIVGILIIGGSFALWFYLQTDTERLEKKIESESLEKSPAQVEVEQQIELINSDLDAITKISLEQNHWSEIVSAIDQATPPGVQVTRLSLSDDEPSRVLGTANSREEVITFGDNLKQIDGISDVENPLSNLSTGEKSIIEFEITFSLK